MVPVLKKWKVWTVQFVAKFNHRGLGVKIKINYLRDSDLIPRHSFLSTTFSIFINWVLKFMYLRVLWWLIKTVLALYKYFIRIRGMLNNRILHSAFITDQELFKGKSKSWFSNLARMNKLLNIDNEEHIVCSVSKGLLC